MKTFLITFYDRQTDTNHKDTLIKNAFSPANAYLIDILYHVFSDNTTPPDIWRYQAACAERKHISRHVMKTPPDFSAGGISQEFLIEHILYNRRH